jgi:hypothetical protein
MYSTDVLVESFCRLCGEKVHIATSRSGRALCRVAPADSLVWYDFAYAYSGTGRGPPEPNGAVGASLRLLRRWLLLTSEDPHSPCPNGRTNSARCPQADAALRAALRGALLTAAKRVGR